MAFASGSENTWLAAGRDDTTTTPGSGAARATSRSRDIASAFHALYNERELRVLSAAEEVKMARLALYAATAQIIRNTLALLGVSAPEHM